MSTYEIHHQRQPHGGGMNSEDDYYYIYVGEWNPRTYLFKIINDGKLAQTVCDSINLVTRLAKALGCEDDIGQVGPKLRMFTIGTDYNPHCRNIRQYWEAERRAILTALEDKQ